MPGAYISYPFCSQKCSFCNFASGVYRADFVHRYSRALLAEIRGHRWAFQPDTIYVGGGTPSQMDAELLASIAADLPGRPWREATIEAAPGSFSRETVTNWRANGINRVSLGVQSFVKEELSQTGRRHDARTVHDDVQMLRSGDIESINIDLIAGLPYQTIESWHVSLDAIERLQPPHVSVYLLEVDTDSRLGLEILGNGSRYGARQAPDDELSADLYEIAVGRLRSMGIERYEISNFARPGWESIHNLKYWELKPYVGFGVDAHSFDGVLRHANTDDPQDYVARFERGETVRVESTTANIDEERFFVGLRLSRGIALTPVAVLPHAAQVRRLQEAGLVEWLGDRLRLTDRGVLLSNEVFGEFVA
jgi:oxygen-independent coproporphyrinogen-3 oxidase